MKQILIVGIVLFVGLILGKIAERVKVPKVTGYILAGVLLNPGIFSFIPKVFIHETRVVTEISLSFITFSVGGTLLFPLMKRMGKRIFYITLFEAEFAFLFVTAGFLLFIPFLASSPGKDLYAVFIPLSILLASLASPTDPSATLAVKHEYKAEGEVSRIVMGVAAFDDAVGLMNYSIAVAIAQTFVFHEKFSIFYSFINPVMIIFGSLLLGILFGLIFNLLSRLFENTSEGSTIVLIFGMLALCFGTANLLKLDELLSTMAMGCIVVNFNKKRESIFQMLERYTEELIFVLFFTISGMHLNLSVLFSYWPYILIFIFFRTLGKFTGSYVGGSLSHSSKVVKKYVGGGLIPQGGIVIGLALMIKQYEVFAGFSDILINIILGTAIFHEVIGPILAKIALKKAGEI